MRTLQRPSKLISHQKGLKSRDGVEVSRPQVLQCDESAQSCGTGGVQPLQRMGVSYTGKTENADTGNPPLNENQPDWLQNLASDVGFQSRMQRMSPIDAMNILLQPKSKLLSR